MAKKPLEKLITAIHSNKRVQLLLVFAIIFGVSGYLLLVSSRAATPGIALEAEGGVVTYPAAKNTDDTAASGSGYVRFNAPAGETWGDHMGISGEINRTNIDRTKSLGLKWLKFSAERGWSFNYSDIDYAHSQGIKVIETCQQTNDSGHNYPLADIYNFANWCAGWVDHGVDAIEIGNEWNHLPFWVPAANGVYTGQALYYDVTSQAIRNKSASIPIITSGFSPESSPNLPQEAIAKVLDASNGQLKSKANRIGAHPYAYNCDDPNKCEYPARKDWNTFLATQDVYAAAKARGFDHPIVFTEIGGPSGNGDNEYTHKPFTPDSQQQLYKQYICGTAIMRAGGVPIDLMMWHTMRDGEASTNKVEQTFGVFDANWNLKPAGWYLAAQAAQPWTSSCVQ